MSIGEKIKELRKNRGWNAETLAENCGISPATIYRYENGSTREPKMSALRKIADALGVDVWTIIGFNSIEYDVDPPVPDPDEDDPWKEREALRDDPHRRALLDLARNGSAEDVRQVAAIIDALRKTNPDFYDGDDPA